MSNTYKGSTRDNVKYLTKNGHLLPVIPNWGWGGHKTLDTAASILAAEFGALPKDSDTKGLAAWLAKQPDNTFALTSNDIALFLGET